MLSASAALARQCANIREQTPVQVLHVARAMTQRTVGRMGGPIGAIAAGCLLLLGRGSGLHLNAQDALGPPLVEPQTILPSGGVAELTLEAAPSRITVADQSFTSNVYNGQ